MIGKGKKERAALDRLADFLVDDILNVSDEDVLAEFREAHGDLDQNTADMQALLEKSILLSNKKRLAAAKMGAVESRRPSLVSSSSPIDMQAARVRLRKLIEAPGVPQKITLAARKESELSDADVIGMLEDLRELGIISADDITNEET
jgi:hypothetical protein